MRTARNGLQLRLGNVAKDEKGFDDLDEFWDAPGKLSACGFVAREKLLRCFIDPLEILRKISFPVYIPTISLSF